MRPARPKEGAGATGTARDAFYPESVPAFSAKTVVSILRNKEDSLKKYRYKEALNNPTNKTDDQATEFEAGLISDFQAALEQLVGPGGEELPKERIDQIKKSDALKPMPKIRRDEDVEPMYCYARPIVVWEKNCLTCHNTVAEAKDAYPGMVELYGETAGYGWRLNAVVAVQIVRSHTSCADSREQGPAVGAAGSLRGAGRPWGRPRSPRTARPADFHPGRPPPWRCGRSLTGRSRRTRRGRRLPAPGRRGAPSGARSSRPG